MSATIQSTTFSSDTIRESVPMSEEQKFIFDLKGWLLIPEALSIAEVASIKQHIETVRKDPQSLPLHLRHSSAGPVANLLDHPSVVGVLREIIAKDTSADAFGFRCDNHYYQYRQLGDRGIEPHGGGPSVGPLFSYQCKNQSIYSGLTRVVCELNEVERGKGGTLLMSGSHKSNFKVPPEHLKRESWVYETYTCPPGSLLFFSENIAHSASTWTNEKHPRIAVFNCYSHIATQFHKNSMPAAVIEAMPLKRRSLFRGAWHADFNQGLPPRLNTEYSTNNSTL